jgi:predicted RNA-binding Zn ribbon-like protein
MKMSEISEITQMQLSLRVFEFVGNNQSLDFTNTLNDRLDATPTELLNGYNDLVAWSRQAGIVTDEQERLLREEAARYPAEAHAVLQQAIAVREILFRIFFSIASGSEPQDADISLLNTALSQAMSKACIVGKDGAFVWEWNARDNDLQRILWPIVRSAADLLTSGDLSATRTCAADDCGWLFLDTSKNKSRRWCNMKTCGNRTKVSRHYERKKHDGHKTPEHSA